MWDKIGILISISWTASTEQRKQTMTDAVKRILNEAHSASENFEYELAKLREVMIASASIVEVTEETENLKNKALEVLLNSDLPIHDIVTAAELIGIDGPDIIRELKR